MEEHGSKLRTCQEQDKARNMLRKAINHIIKEKISQKKLGKSFGKKGVWIVAKKLHPHP